MQKKLRNKNPLSSEELDKKEYIKIQVQKFLSNYPESDINSPKPNDPLKLRNVALKNKLMAQIPLDPVVLSSICGTIFGDTAITINKNYKNARLQMRHSTRQTEWFFWKTLRIFKEFLVYEELETGNVTSISLSEPDGFQIKSPEKTNVFLVAPLRENNMERQALGKWKVLTRADEKLTMLYKILCPDNKKKFQRFWLNHMNNYFLMVLWLDDGSLVGARQGIISCNNTPLAQAKVLANYLSTVWEVHCKAVVVKSKATPTLLEPVQISISDLDNLEKILRIIAPIVPVKSMLYKVCLYPIESSRLQRWTSELKTLVRQDWHNEIDKIYADLKKYH